MRNKKLLLLVVLVLILGCAQVIAPQKNNPPEARFSINPKVGNTQTKFILDGSFSSDDQDSVKNLTYFWEIFSSYGKRIDSVRGMVDTATFSDTGIHIINLTVFDSDSLFDSIGDTVLVNPYLEPAISSLDSAITFGPVEIGYTVSKNIKLTNLGQDTLKIDAVYFTGEDKAAFASNFESELSILPDSNKTLEVQFLPADTGEYKAFININSNDPQNPGIKAPLKGEGFQDLFDIDIVNMVSDTIDFGVVNAGADSTFVIELRNKSDNPREILAAYVTGAGKEAFDCEFPGEFIIDAGQTRDLEISFTPEDTVRYGAELIIKSDDPFSRKKTIKLSGRGYTNLPVLQNEYLSGDTLFFEKTESGLSSTRKIKLINRGNSTLNINAVYTTGSGKDVFTSNFSSNLNILPQEEKGLNISFNPDSNLSYIAKLVIMNDNKLNNRQELYLKGTGIKNQLRVTKPRNEKLEYNRLSVGNDSTLKIEITNTGQEMKKVVAAYIIGENKDYFSCDFNNEIPVYPDEKIELDVTFAPQSEGDFAATLVIMTNEEVAKKKYIALSGEGFQIAPQIKVENVQKPISFGYVLINSDSSKTLTISNQGQAQLDILAVYFTGTHADLLQHDFSQETAIAPDKSKHFEIAYSPVSNEKLEDTYLNIFSNDPDTAIKKILIEGQGTHPPQVASQDTLNFGEVAIDASRQLTLQVKNIGQGPLINLNLKLESLDFDYQYSQNIDLLPGTAINIPVAFSPVSTGEKSVQLILNSDNHGEFKTIHLIGTAVE